MRVDPPMHSTPAAVSNNTSLPFVPVFAVGKTAGCWPPGGCMVGLGFSVYSDCESLVGNRLMKLWSII